MLNTVATFAGCLLAAVVVSSFIGTGLALLLFGRPKPEHRSRITRHGSSDQPGDRGGLRGERASHGGRGSL